MLARKSLQTLRPGGRAVEVLQGPGAFTSDRTNFLSGDGRACPTARQIGLQGAIITWGSLMFNLPPHNNSRFVSRLPGVCTRGRGQIRAMEARSELDRRSLSTIACPRTSILQCTWTTDPKHQRAMIVVGRPCPREDHTLTRAGRHVHTTDTKRSLRQKPDELSWW